MQILLKEALKRNINLNTGFQLACYHGYSRVVEILLRETTEVEIDFNAVDEIGRTGFHWSCFKGHLAVIKLLVEDSNELRRINFLAKDNFGDTGYNLAVQNNKNNVTEYLQYQGYVIIG